MSLLARRLTARRWTWSAGWRLRFAPPLLLAAAAAPITQLVPGRVVPDPSAVHELVPGRVAPPPSVAAPSPAPSSVLAPNIVLRLALPPAMEARLRYAQALLGHAVPGGDPVEVFGRALESLIRATRAPQVRAHRASAPAAGGGRGSRHGATSHRPRPREARGLAARPGPLRVRLCAGPALLVAHTTRVRPPRAGGARRDLARR